MANVLITLAAFISPTNEDEAAFPNHKGALKIQFNENGCCLTDPEIQLQRTIEDVVWTMVQPHCPLCETQFHLSLLGLLFCCPWPLYPITLLIRPLHKQHPHQRLQIIKQHRCNRTTQVGKGEKVAVRRCAEPLYKNSFLIHPFLLLLYCGSLPVINQLLPNLATIAEQLFEELKQATPDWARVRQWVQECPMSSKILTTMDGFPCIAHAGIMPSWTSFSG
jgi:hypothetical protein